MSSTFPTHPTSLTAEFEIKVKELTRTSVIHNPPRPFILTQSLLEWLRTTTTPGALQSTRVLRLLEEVLPRSSRTPNDIDRLNTSMDADQEKCVIKTFAILLLLHCGDYIGSFLDTDMVDRKLPLELSQIEDAVRNLEKPALADFATKFYKRQYQVCTPEAFGMFTRSTSQPVSDENQILPIEKMEPIKTDIRHGEVPKVYQIAIPDECLSQDITMKANEQGISVRQFALKIVGSVEEYKRESFAYRALAKKEGVVQCLGWWEFRISPSSSQYHLLLEYGSYDMDEYFETFHEAPKTLKSITDFWKGLLDIVKGLEALHDCQEKGGTKNEVYFGWHADIKPENILMCEGKGSIKQWKIADPGYTRLLRQGDQDLSFDENKNPKAIIKGGTTTYGPPEQASKPRAPVTRGIDIWALGCVFSEAATYINTNYSGILQFRDIRRTKVLDPAPPQPNSNTPEGTDDCFHDGTKLSISVEAWHIYLRQIVRKDDTLTPKILDLIDNDMLLPSGSKRSSAKIIREKMENLLNEVDKQAAVWYRCPSYFENAFRRQALESEERWRNPGSCGKSRGRKTNRHKSSQDDSSSDGLNALGYWDALHGLESEGWENKTTLAPTRELTVKKTDTPPTVEPPPREVRGNGSSGELSPPETQRRSDTRFRTSTSRGSTRPQPREKEKSNNFWSGLRLSPEGKKSKQALATVEEALAPVVIESPPVREEVTSPPTTIAGLKNHRYNELSGHIFILVDNSPAMAQHWQRLRDLISVHVALLHGQGADGMSLFFTSPSTANSSPPTPLYLPQQFADNLSANQPSPSRSMARMSSLPLMSGAVSRVTSPRDSTSTSTSVAATTTITTNTSTTATSSSCTAANFLRSWKAVFSVIEDLDEPSRITLLVYTDGQWLKGPDGEVVNEVLEKGIESRIGEWGITERDGGLGRMMNEGDFRINFVVFGGDESCMGILRRWERVRIEGADGDINAMLFGGGEGRHS